MGAGIPTITLRCPGRKPIRIRRGERLRVGRHGSNDIVLADDTVSRFHATIQWDKDEDRPYIEDNASANGVEVDGEQIDGKAYLPGGNQIIIGKFLMVAEYSLRESMRDTSASSALPIQRGPDESDAVSLVDETAETQGDDAGGRIADMIQLHRLLVDLEQERRTGTLTLRVSAALRGSIVFCMGKVMSATLVDHTGREALKRLITIGSAIYTMSREFKPADAPLDISIRSFLARELPDATRKIGELFPSPRAKPKQ